MNDQEFRALRCAESLGKHARFILRCLAERGGANDFVSTTDEPRDERRGPSEFKAYEFQWLDRLSKARLVKIDLREADSRWVARLTEFGARVVETQPIREAERPIHQSDRRKTTGKKRLEEHDELRDQLHKLVEAHGLRKVIRALGAIT